MAEGEEQLTLRDLMNEIKQQRAEVQNLKEHVQGNSYAVTSQVNKLKKDKDIVWRYKGNKVQYEFNEDLSENVEQISGPYKTTR